MRPLAYTPARPSRRYCGYEPGEPGRKAGTQMDAEAGGVKWPAALPDGYTGYVVEPESGGLADRPNEYWTAEDEGTGRVLAPPSAPHGADWRPTVATDDRVKILPAGASLRIMVDGVEVSMNLTPREFSTGSIGYHTQGKVDGEGGRRYQVNFTATLIGSKPTQ